MSLNLIKQGMLFNITEDYGGYRGPAIKRVIYCIVDFKIIQPLDTLFLPSF